MADRAPLVNPEASRRGTEGQSCEEEEAELIARWLEPDPDTADKAVYRIAGYGVQVWALTGYLRGEHGPTDQHLDEAARTFHLPREAVEAALAFYRQHPSVLDDRFDASQA
jgi:uncharacterized protein (DUF433 family)